MVQPSVITENLFCLTGGIATGKSRVMDWFSARGWVVICSDEIVHRLYEPGQSLPQQIAKEFGNAVLTSQGGIHRAKLGEIVFGDPSAIQRLNKLVHPQVAKKWKALANKALCGGKKVLVVIPLAYEVQVTHEFSETWVVACSLETQKTRMRQRGLNDSQMDRRLSTQWPIQKKIDLADRVIWNDASWFVTEEQLESLYTSLN